MLEKVRCNLCNSSYDSLKYIKNDFRIVRCRCGLVYVNPRKEIEYDKSYFSRKGSVYEDYLEESNLKKKNFRRLIKDIKKLTFSEKKKLLDIGCGTGEFLEVAKENGYEVKGVEISEFAVGYCSGKHLCVDIGDFDKIDIKEKFDIVTMFDFIEHSKDPFKDLRKVNEILSEDGLLVVVSGNIDSWFAKLMGRKWNFLNPEEHLYYFSEKTLRNMLNKAGFGVIKIKKDFRYVSFNNFFRYFKVNLKFGRFSFLVWLPSMMVVFVRKK